MNSNQKISEVKLQCSSDSRCAWILDKECNNGNFALCASNSTLQQSKKSCVYTKYERRGKNSILFNKHRIDK